MSAAARRGSGGHSEPHPRGAAACLFVARGRARRYHGRVPSAATARKAPVLEKLFPAIVVAACLVLLLRLLLGERRRHRFDRGLARWSRSLGARIEGLFTWNAGRRRARRAAEEAIRRAREGGEWDGNVYRPKSFGKKSDRKIH